MFFLILRLLRGSSLADFAADATFAHLNRLDGPARRQAAPARGSVLDQIA